MFYVAEVHDYVRVEPELFGLPIKEAIKKQLEKTFKDYADNELGIVIGVFDILNVGDGILIPGDAAAYYESEFRLIVFKPKLQELVYGKISQITNFGAFMNIGVTEAMIHISQTMDDYTSFSKSNALIGRTTKRTLKKNDICLARIVAISFKSMPPKISLTMRQPGLGKLEWIQEDKRKAKRMLEKEAKEEKKKGKKEK